MTHQKPPKRLWGGRFRQATDALVQEFNASIGFDHALALEDIEGSLVHATMLMEQGILTPAEGKRIHQGLEDIRREVEAGTFSWREEFEDVHMNIEHALSERIGALGGKLHTARSRNDQVATDFRLWLRGRTLELIALLHSLREVMVTLAEANLRVIMPGYTHLQIAQPILFSHHLLAYYEMFSRDQERYREALARLDVSPLGAGALAGTSFPIDRRRTAQLLGFREPAANSLDAVSDRDFALEFLADSSITMMHLSRLSEELILWSSQEFGFVTLADAFATGSSIMPQKKNPDVPELIRGKTGRVYGALMGLLTVMKGLPLAYNKDMQEDKEGVMDTARTVKNCLRLLIAMLPELTIHEEHMKRAAGQAFSNATDLADYLAARGLPFREAHEVVGRLVTIALGEGKELHELSIDTMRQACELIGEDVYRVLELNNVVNARSSYGGTAEEQVAQQLERARARLVSEEIR